MLTIWPTFKRCLQDRNSVTNIQKLSPSTSHQHHCYLETNLRNHWILRESILTQWTVTVWFFFDTFFHAKKIIQIDCVSQTFYRGFSVAVNTLKQFRYSLENPPNSSGLIPKRWNASALSIPEIYMVAYKSKKPTWTRSPWKNYCYLKTYRKKMKIWKTKVAFFCSRF